MDVYQWRIRGINKKLDRLADHFIKHWILLLWFIWLIHCFLFYYFSLLTFFWKYAKAPWGFCSQMQNVTNQHSNKTFTLTHFLSRRNTTGCIQSSGFWKPHLLKSFICLHQLKDFVLNWTAECHTHTHFFVLFFIFSISKDTDEHVSSLGITTWTFQPVSRMLFNSAIALLIWECTVSLDMYYSAFLSWRYLAEATLHFRFMNIYCKSASWKIECVSVLLCLFRVSVDASWS